MQVRWPFRLRAPESKSVPNLTAASESLFRTEPLAPLNVMRTPGQPRQAGVYLVTRNEAPYARSRSAEDMVLTRSEVPALSVASGPSGCTYIVGRQRDEWSLRLSAAGEGNSEAEALERANAVSLLRTGATVTLHGPNIGSGGMRCKLIVEAPADAPTTVHGTFAPVEIRDMTGPVRVTAIRARAKILNTTGHVDACAPIIDFAAFQGDVILSAEWDINLKFTSDSFRGSLMAWAQRSVRVLIPESFRSAFRVVVNRPQDCVCRTKFRQQLRHENENGLCVFTFEGDGTSAAEAIHLRSEHAQVILDGF